MVAMAARESFSGAYGPSYLEIPRDILDAEIPIEKAVIPEPGHYRASVRMRADERDIEKVAELLNQAERPAVLFGQQVWTSGSAQDAIDFVRALDIPAYMNGAARGMLPPGDPHHLDRTRRMAFSEADVLLIVGTPFDFRMGYGKRISDKLKLIQLDLDYRIVGKNRDVDVGLPGHPGANLTAIVQAVSGSVDQGKKQLRQQWMQKLQDAEGAALEKLMPLFTSDQSPI